jgi:hypothetical protein
MDSLPRPFIIEIDGKPIPKANDPLSETDYGGPTGEHAKIVSEPAVFELHGHCLICDGLVLSRYPIEDLSLMPKKVYWSKANEYPDHHRIFAEKKGDGYSLTMSGMYTL